MVRYVAVPRPGRTPAIVIVLPEQGRVLKTLYRASLPAGPRITIPGGGSGFVSARFLGYKVV